MRETSTLPAPTEGEADVLTQRGKESGVENRWGAVKWRGDAFHSRGSSTKRREYHPASLKLKGYGSPNASLVPKSMRRRGGREVLVPRKLVPERVNPTKPPETVGLCRKGERGVSDHPLLPPLERGEKRSPKGVH